MDRLKISADVIVYIVKFPSGEVQYRVVGESCDVVQFRSGIYYFESEGYHLSEWTHENHLELEVKRLTVEV